MLQYGSKLLENHSALEWREDRLENLKNLESITADPYSKSRVPMDFSSGVSGRVVTDPSEAIGIVVEEGTRLRVSDLIWHNGVHCSSYRKSSQRYL